ncbi:hypothetical protein [Streptomyces sp. TLI_171]|uniref:hypothetical protein n=1 Tax=Streptomyces sp. TLI_171 TaxID=1938859 RepID=UPI000C64B430|nr:hypothetical protein [Streptomyces sp. TLI_171]RKE17549.1 hypothetical protein BX266_0808 [Streptomyces sp. TLI_171]
MLGRGVEFGAQVADQRGDEPVVVVGPVEALVVAEVVVVAATGDYSQLRFLKIR